MMWFLMTKTKTQNPKTQNPKPENLKTRIKDEFKTKSKSIKRKFIKHDVVFDD